jgi:hypothetical protein
MNVMTDRRNFREGEAGQLLALLNRRQQNDVPEQIAYLGDDSMENRVFLCAFHVLQLGTKEARRLSGFATS